MQDAIGLEPSGSASRWRSSPASASECASIFEAGRWCGQHCHGHGNGPFKPLPSAATASFSIVLSRRALRMPTCKELRAGAVLALHKSDGRPPKFSRLSLFTVAGVFRAFCTPEDATADASQPFD